MCVCMCMCVCVCRKLSFYPAQSLLCTYTRREGERGFHACIVGRQTVVRSNVESVDVSQASPLPVPPLPTWCTQGGRREGEGEGKGEEEA